MWPRERLKTLVNGQTVADFEAWKSNGKVKSNFGANVLKRMLSNELKVKTLFLFLSTSLFLLQSLEIGL